MVTLNQLQTFLTVLQEGSFTAAAYKLHLTQPAVSGHIGALEKELGTLLFDRVGKKIVVTDAGKIVNECAQSIFKKIDQLQNRVKALENFQGSTITIGASKIIGNFLLPKLIVAFQEKFPEIHLELHIHSARTVIAKLISNEYDIALIAEIDQIPEDLLGSRVIAREEFVIIASPASSFAKKKSFSRKDLMQENFILPGKKTASSFGIQKMLKKVGVKLKGSLEINGAGAIKRAVSEGNRLAIVSKSTVREELESGKLITIPTKDIILERNILLLWRHDRKFSKTTEEFLKFLQKNWSKQ